jgi:S-DNA-T family DNA segregation ATPase FtsK/SpoIIIE
VTTADTLDRLFERFRVDARVSTVDVGPTYTRYAVSLGDGVAVERVIRLQRTIAVATQQEAARVTVGAELAVEVPNVTRRIVPLHPLSGPPLTVPVGETVQNRPIKTDLARLPHLLVAGSTGSGKSSFLNAALCTLLAQPPDAVRLVLIDPKRVEFTPYAAAPHLWCPVLTDTGESVTALEQLGAVMEDRYAALATAGAREVTTEFPRIVVVVDELADLMFADRKRVEAAVVRIAQKARAVGIHLVLATQRPSVDVVTGLIKANVPARVSFVLPSQIDSRVVLDRTGAEHLLGHGDGLFSPVAAHAPVRFQGALVTDTEVQQAVRRAAYRWPAPAAHTPRRTLADVPEPVLSATTTTGALTAVCEAVLAWASITGRTITRRQVHEMASTLLARRSIPAVPPDAWLLPLVAQQAASVGLATAF